jgi:hypothetical protein
MMLSRVSWVLVRGFVNQQRHPGLPVVQVWVLGLGGGINPDLDTHSVARSETIVSLIESI